jgi:hypothetical protein
MVKLIEMDDSVTATANRECPPSSSASFFCIWQRRVPESGVSMR